MTREELISILNYDAENGCFYWISSRGRVCSGELAGCDKDTDCSNNVFSNLRLSSQLENTYNRSMQSNNKSGIKGVHWHAQSGMWRAVLTVRGRKITLGRFNSLEDAKLAVDIRRASEHGEFARDS